MDTYIPITEEMIEAGDRYIEELIESGVACLEKIFDIGIQSPPGQKSEKTPGNA